MNDRTEIRSIVRSLVTGLVLMLCAALIAACAGGPISMAPTPTSTATFTPAATPTCTVTSTATPEPTEAPPPPEPTPSPVPPTPVSTEPPPTPTLEPPTPSPAPPATEAPPQPITFDIPVGSGIEVYTGPDGQPTGGTFKVEIRGVTVISQENDYSEIEYVASNGGTYRVWVKTTDVQRCISGEQPPAAPAEAAPSPFAVDTSRHFEDQEFVSRQGATTFIPIPESHFDHFLMGMEQAISHLVLL